MIPWNHMLLNSEWHVHLTYYLEKSDKKMMDINLKKSWTIEKKTALKQNVKRERAVITKHAAKGKFFPK